jgi:ATP-dependent protease HslVU (ClpYQ) peptidase subunit
MTTLVVVRKHNEVAIAADSLTTFGDTRLSAQFDRTYDKIMRYRDTYVGLVGSAAHQLVFESLLTQHKDLDFGSKGAIFETFRKLHPILKDQHFLNPKEEEDDPYESTQITALIANIRCAKCSSTRSSGQSGRGASLRWARCTRSTADCAPRPPSPRPASRPGRHSTKTRQCR